MEPDNTTIAELQRQLAEKEAELGRVSNELVGIKEELTRVTAERSQAEEWLGESDEHFRLFVEQSHDVVYSVAPDGIINYLSPYFASFGYSTEEVISRNFIEFVAPEQRQHVIESFETGTRDGTSFPTVFKWMKKDGDHVWVEVIGNTIYDDSGNPVQQVGVMRDISKRKEQEEKNRSLLLLLDTADAECFIKDRDGKYLYVNRAFEEQFGVKREELIGKDDTFLFNPELAAELQINDQRIMASRKKEAIEEAGIVQGKHVTYR